MSPKIVFSFSKFNIIVIAIQVFFLVGVENMFIFIPFIAKFYHL